VSVKKGKVYVVGLGPGGMEQMTSQAVQAIEASDTVVGYQVYINLIKDLVAAKEVISSGMRQEMERCETALSLAREGKTVSLVSSGDPGIYGMAGPLLELNSQQEDPVEVVVVPGITAASMAAAILGAPLMHDTVFISLSDHLTPWDIIKKRLHLAAEGDFITALYNPRSYSRPHYLQRAQQIFLNYRKKETVVGIVRNAARDGQEKIITTLEELPDFGVDMFTLVIIGSSRTYACGGKMITPRGYTI